MVLVSVRCRGRDREFLGVKLGIGFWSGLWLGLGLG